VALQYSDGVDVINTKAMKVIKTLHVGQSPMALVYVARSAPGSTAGLSHQGLGRRNEYLPATAPGLVWPGGAACPRWIPGSIAPGRT